MKSRIVNKLKNIEEEHDVKVLYACESGSRVWGFDNDESDYDVRFIFKKNNLNDYLRLSDSFDVIDYDEDNLDFVGWDVSKALKLHYKDNPNLREWILSPIKYVDWDENIFTNLPKFDRTVLQHYYYSIASNNWKTIFNRNMELTKRVVKMYMYNCRCLLSWIVINEGNDPSINIFDLLKQAENVDIDIKRHIWDLTAYYKNNCQGNLDFEVIKKLNSWNSNTLFYIRNHPPVKKEDLGLMAVPYPEKFEKNIEEYNIRFFDILLPDYYRYLEWKK